MSRSSEITWVLEQDVFPDSHAAMREAVLNASGEVIAWKDSWLKDDSWPPLPGEVVVFHGSLGNAATIADRLPWKPGSFCDTTKFHCSHWYPKAQSWLLHQVWTLSTVQELVTSPQNVLARVGNPESLFVRPDSPLKPFSGRVLHRDNISPRALDHGFYYDDMQLPIVIAQVQSIQREWRYVVVEGQVVAGSAYQAAGHKALPDDAAGQPWSFANDIAERMEAPQGVFVMDICEANGSLHLLELNPFSGADLYACDRTAVVKSVSSLATRLLKAC